MKQVIKIKPPRLWLLIVKVKSLWMQVFLQIPTLKKNPQPKLMRNNLFQRSLMPQRTTRMICNCKYPSLPEMMPSTWVQCLWDHQNPNQQEWSSIPVLNILPSHPHYVTTKLLVTLNSRSMIHSQALSCKETNWTKDAKLKHMTWKNQNLIKSSQRHHLSWHMVQLNSKVSFGKIMLASSHSRAPQQN